MFKSKIIIALISLMLTVGCAGSTSEIVEPMQRKDKQLTCKEIMLEMNEAEFYSKMALKNKNPGITGILMPLSYVSTYMDAQEAMNAAKARVEYLDRIYQIMDCDLGQDNTMAYAKEYMY